MTNGFGTENSASRGSATLAPARVSAAQFSVLTPLPSAASRRPSLLLICTVLLLTTPYLQWFGVGTESDVQPYALIVALTICAFNTRYIDRKDLPILALVIAAVLIFAAQVVFTAEVGPAVRGIYGYIALGPTIMAWVLLLRRCGNVRLRGALIVSFWVWSLTGLIQHFVPEFGTMWREKLVYAGERGTLSLATEPAYFAFAVLFLSIAIVHLGGRYAYIPLAAVVSVAIAQSSIGLLYAGVILLVYSTVKLRWRLLALVLAALAVTGIAIANPESRIATAPTRLFTEPTELIREDQSIGLRYVNLDYPIRATIEDNFLPHGLTAWKDTLYKQSQLRAREYTWDLAYVNSASHTERILSIHGQLWFELGFLAVVYYFLLYRLLAHSRRKYAFAIILFFMFFNGVTLNSPFLALLFAVAFAERNASSTRDPQ